MTDVMVRLLARSDPQILNLMHKERPATPAKPLPPEVLAVLHTSPGVSINRDEAIDGDNEIGLMALDDGGLEEEENMDDDP